jgi:hypothetical protein
MANLFGARAKLFGKTVQRALLPLRKKFMNLKTIVFVL